MEGTGACSLLTQPGEQAAKCKNVNKRSLSIYNQARFFIALHFSFIPYSAYLPSTVLYVFYPFKLIPSFHFAFFFLLPRGYLVWIFMVFFSPGFKPGSALLLKFFSLFFSLSLCWTRLAPSNLRGKNGFDPRELCRFHVTQQNAFLFFSWHPWKKKTHIF